MIFMVTFFGWSIYLSATNDRFTLSEITISNNALLNPLELSLDREQFQLAIFFGFHPKVVREQGKTRVVGDIANEDIERYFRINYASESYTPETWDDPLIRNFTTKRCNNDYM